MKVYNHKKWTLIILLLFVGQVVSAPLLSCSPSQMDTHSMSVMDMSAMSNHDMSLMQDSNTSEVVNSISAMDCCADECGCLLGMCLSFALYLNPSTEMNFSKASAYIYLSNPAINKRTITSIYRPPIFC